MWKYFENERKKYYSNNKAKQVGIPLGIFPLLGWEKWEKRTNVLLKQVSHILSHLAPSRWVLVPFCR